MKETLGINPAEDCVLDAGKRPAGGRELTGGPEGGWKVPDVTLAWLA